jgi:N-methylhydantoinase B
MKHPARGRNGGTPGGATVVQLSDGTQYPAKARFTVPSGQTVQLGFPGGGGMGSPSERDFLAVARDVRLGYVSEGAAKRDYGWEP